MNGYVKYRRGVRDLWALGVKGRNLSASQTQEGCCKNYVDRRRQNPDSGSTPYKSEWFTGKVFIDIRFLCQRMIRVRYLGHIGNEPPDTWECRDRGQRRDWCWLGCCSSGAVCIWNSEWVTSLHHYTNH